MIVLKVGGVARLAKRKNDQAKGNAYPILAISKGKARLGHPTKPDKEFDLRDLSYK